MAPLELDLDELWGAFLNVAEEMEAEGLMHLDADGARLSEAGVAWMGERGLPIDRHPVYVAARQYAQERRDEAHAEVRRNRTKLGHVERALAEEQRRKRKERRRGH